MSKDELEKQIRMLKEQVAQLQNQLNNHICDRPAPVYAFPYVPPDGTVKPHEPFPVFTWCAPVAESFPFARPGEVIRVDP